jgi:HSP20 family protein
MLVKWRPMRSLLPEIFEEDIFDWDIFPSRLTRTTEVTSFQPRIEVREKADEYLVEAEMPGLDKKDFQLTLEGNTLTLRGEKKHEHVEEGEQYYRRERAYGTFTRSFTLTDDVDRDKIKAEYKNGVLTIHLPKTEKARGKQIPVEVK